MSGKRTKILRAVFEEKTGLSEFHRNTDLYKSEWRKFKKDVKRGRR